MDNSVSATSFTVERAADSGFTTDLTTFTVPVAQCEDQAGCARTFTDESAVAAAAYFYRVRASNTVGSLVPNYPTITVDSAAWSNTVNVPAIPPPAVNPPTNLTATIVSANRIRLTWIDASNNENNFAVWRSVNGSGFTQIGTVNRSACPTHGHGRYGGLQQQRRVGRQHVRLLRDRRRRHRSVGPSNTVTVPFTVPAAPTGLAGFASVIPGNPLQDTVALTWTDNAINESNYRIQRCVRTTPASCGPSGNWVNVSPLQPADTTAFSETRSKLFDWAYRVRALNALGNSAWSNIVIVITP